MYVDTTDSALLVTNSLGALAGTVTIPGSAVPGAHWITAGGRRSGLRAQAQFRVQTDWAQRGSSASHPGYKPVDLSVDEFAHHVALIGPSGYGKTTCTPLWHATTGSTVDSSPAVSSISAPVQPRADDRQVRVQTGRQDRG